nr:hypothetical protein [uncultured Enterobacter sp.]
MKSHPDKHLRAAIDYALSEGWTFTPGGASAHCFGRLVCGSPGHKDHMMSIWSTPRSAQNHAKQIIRMVRRCHPES